MPTPPISKWSRTDNQIYAADRYALNSLTKMMALQLRDMGVTTIALYPGMIRTDMNQHSAQAIPAAEGIPKVVNTVQSVTPDQNGLAVLPDGTVCNW